MVRGDQDMEGSVLVVADLLLTPEFTQSSTVLGITPVWERLQLGYKTGDLLLPVVQGRRR